MSSPITDIRRNLVICASCPSAVHYNTSNDPYWDMDCRLYGGFSGERPNTAGAGDDNDVEQHYWKKVHRDCPRIVEQIVLSQEQTSC